MSRGFVNHLKSLDNFRDYRHASHLYLDNNYEYTPKASWIYYVVIEVNSNISSVIEDTRVREDFITWYEKYKGQVGLLAKTVDMPNFTIKTETLNQYNKKTVIQTGIEYSTMGITFHDDMANMTTNLWKSYYQYYYGDGVDTIKKFKSGNAYDQYSDITNYRYGLNNGQNEPFFKSFTIYQLHQRKYTSFKIINPLVKSWKHEALDQTQGNKLLTSTMQVDYEAVIYDTDQDNKVTREDPGFNRDHYDVTPSPLAVGPTNGQFLPAGRDDVFGTLNNPRPSPLDRLSRPVGEQSTPTRLRPASPNSIPSQQLRSITASQTPNGVIISEPLAEIGGRNPAGISIPNGVPPNPANSPTTKIPTIPPTIVTPPR